MAMKVTVSFKDHEEEMYKYVNSKMSKTIYLKELIKKDMDKNNNINNTVNKKFKQENPLDFI